MFPCPQHGSVMPDRLRLIHIRIWTFFRQEDGQGVPEYALLIALIALVAIVALQFLDGGIRHTYTVAANSV